MSTTLIWGLLLSGMVLAIVFVIQARRDDGDDDEIH
jgi:hypothetical protein